MEILTISMFEPGLQKKYSKYNGNNESEMKFKINTGHRGRHITFESRALHMIYYRRRRHHGWRGRTKKFFENYIL